MDVRYVDNFFFPAYAKNVQGRTTGASLSDVSNVDGNNYILICNI